MSHAVSSLLVCGNAAVSFRELSEILPRHITGSLVTAGIYDPPRERWNWLATFPFFRARYLDFAGLKFILAHEMTHSSPWRSHLHPGMDVVVTIMSSMNALKGGWQVPDLDIGPLHSFLHCFLLPLGSAESPPLYAVCVASRYSWDSSLFVLRCLCTRFSQEGLLVIGPQS